MAKHRHPSFRCGKVAPVAADQGKAEAAFKKLPITDMLLQELRKGKYHRTNSSDPDVLNTIVQLGLHIEGTASHAGAVLLPPATVEALLVDKRQTGLVHSFRLAMLKLASQVGFRGTTAAE